MRANWIGVAAALLVATSALAVVAQGGGSGTIHAYAIRGTHYVKIGYPNPRATRIAAMGGRSSSEKQVRAFAGKPGQVYFEKVGPGVSYKHLSYGSRNGKHYVGHKFQRTRKARAWTLIDFGTNSPSFAAPGGARVGMTTKAAERREGIARPRPWGCGSSALIRHWGPDYFDVIALYVSRGHVTSLEVSGPHPGPC